MDKITLYWKLIVIALLVLALVIIFPFLVKIIQLVFKENITTSNELIYIVTRTITFAITSSLALLFFGFAGALVLKKISLLTKVGKNLGILILPVSLGNISIAFMTKLLIGESEFFSELISNGVLAKLGFLVLLQLWQYGLLFVYIFWLNFNSIKKVTLEYSDANKFSYYQNIKDIYYPHSQSLIILLASIGFIFSVFEESKIQFLFKASRGTNSELITNWLIRTYQTYLVASPMTAESQLYYHGGIIAIFVIVVLGLLYLFFNLLQYVISIIEFYPNNNKTKFPRLAENHLPLTFSALLILIVIVPIIISLKKISFDFNSSLLSLGFPIFMTIIATLTSTILAVIFGISARLGWKYKLRSFNNQSLFFFLSMFLLLTVPPMVVLVSGFNWMGILGYHSNSFIFIIWIAGHTILTLPILGSFVLFNHFRVSVNEIDYSNVFKLSSLEIVKLTFLSRFKAEYFLLFLIGFSFIWNEAVINNIFSDNIPSFASGLKMLITGRGADYSLAFGYLLVSIFIAISVVIMWRSIIQKFNDTVIDK